MSEKNINIGIKTEVKMDPVLLIVNILKLLADTYGSGIVQKALSKFQAQEVSRSDFESIAPNDAYSKPAEST